MENTSEKNSRRNVCFLLLTAIIWGVAFVAQRKGGNEIGPYLFSALRFYLGAIVLLPVIKILDGLGFSGKEGKSKERKKTVWLGGVICGLLLGSFTLLQQLGLFYGTTAGKAGFLTACYIVLVPIFGLFLKRKCGWNVWLAVAITLAGLYLLCMKDGISIQKSDLFVLACSVLCSFHILVVDHFTVKVDGVRMSCIQFLVAGTLALMLSFCQASPKAQLEGCRLAMQSGSFWISLLYTGVMSSGVAYTLQIVGQKNMNPTIASLLLSLESVFSVLAGSLILKETMGSREITGCVCIFVAVVLAQLEFGRKKA